MKNINYRMEEKTDGRKDMLSRRSRYMAERSDRVIAVYDGREKGGTVRTIRFAHQMKKELREIPVGEIVLPGHPVAKRK